MMIKTTYVLLKKAAEMLDTDEDTLLIAAIEERITLFGFLGENVKAWLMTPDTTSEEPDYSFDDCHRWFGFVPLDSRNAAEIFKNEYCSITDTLSEPEENGSFYHIDESQFNIFKIENYPKIPRKNICLKQTDIDAIHEKASLPEPHTVPESPIRKGAIRKANNTFLNIIGGLLQLLLHVTDQEGNKRSTYVSQADIIADLEDKFPMVQGLKKSNLESKFAEANNSIKQ